ncbi:MAG: hypothetical protein AUK31_05265 [Fibrobacteres bacterium CG2_30_45_31]|nr:MAG: hypothetical protein AUK31_05265 [Fibrobacteres bacterium CG2_30_45_31]
MEYGKLQSCAILFLCIGIAELQAQAQLYVKLKDGTQTVYSLSGIQKLTFPTDSVVVTKPNATPQSYALSNIRFLSFTDYTITAIPKVKKQERNCLKLFLSPASEELQISYQATKYEMVQIRIINMQGKIILTQAHENTKGENNVKFNISELPEGLYIVSNGAESRPVIKHIK